MKHLLKKLADKLKLEKPNTKTLQAAGILDENNNFTKPYINLNNNDSHNNITMRDAKFSQTLVKLASKIVNGSIIKIDNKYYKVKDLG